MLVCAHKERQALHYLGKEHQIGCSGCTECQPGRLSKNETKRKQRWWTEFIKRDVGLYFILCRRPVQA